MRFLKTPIYVYFSLEGHCGKHMFSSNLKTNGQTCFCNGIFSQSENYKFDLKWILYMYYTEKKKVCFTPQLPGLSHCSYSLPWWWYPGFKSISQLMTAKYDEIHWLVASSQPINLLPLNSRSSFQNLLLPKLLISVNDTSTLWLWCPLWIYS